MLKKWEMTNIASVEKKEPSYTVGGNADWSSLETSQTLKVPSIGSNNITPGYLLQETLMQNTNTNAYVNSYVHTTL